jgi:hypothetical protein
LILQLRVRACCRDRRERCQTPQLG